MVNTYNFPPVNIKENMKFQSLLWSDFSRFSKKQLFHCILYTVCKPQLLQIVHSVKHMAWIEPLCLQHHTRGPLLYIVKHCLCYEAVSSAFPIPWRGVLVPRREPLHNCVATELHIQNGPRRGRVRMEPASAPWPGTFVEGVTAGLSVTRHSGKRHGSRPACRRHERSRSGLRPGSVRRAGPGSGRVLVDLFLSLFRMFYFRRLGGRGVLKARRQERSNC